MSDENVDREKVSFNLTIQAGFLSNVFSRNKLVSDPEVQKPFPHVHWKELANVGSHTVCFDSWFFIQKFLLKK